MSHYYDFQGNPIDAEEWGELFQDIDRRRVGLTTGDGWEVSTVWLGLDHSFFGSGPPLIFETMTFGTSLDLQARRYSTWTQAKIGHEEAVAEARAAYELDGRIETE